MNWDESIREAKIELGYGSEYIEDWNELVKLTKDILAENRKEKKEEIQEDYHNYLNSEEWKLLRLKILLKNNYKCKYCGGKATQVHHLNYDSLHTKYEENVCVPLCELCHTKKEIIKLLLKQKKLITPKALDCLNNWQEDFLQQVIKSDEKIISMNYFEKMFKNVV